MHLVRNSMWLVIVAVMLNSWSCSSSDIQADRYIAAVQSFADRVLESGRDNFGDVKTPLFVDGMHVQSLDPGTWKGPEGDTWVLSNLASQQPLFRLLDGLSALTDDARYRDAAENAARYALVHQITPNGLLYWGGHAAWDLNTESAVGNRGDIRTHELKAQQAYFRLMWRIDPNATRQLMETIWAGHILDWSLLDYNRHSSNENEPTPPWEHAFNNQIEVPYPSLGNNLSFCNVTPVLLQSGLMLALLDNNVQALEWTRRLIYRWQEARDPKTGLSGGQLSYREFDRAQEALGHVHPGINEAKIVATYHQTSRYHTLPLVQMLAGEELRKIDGKFTEVGNEFIAWASDDLQVYARNCFDEATGKFNAMMIDGTPIQWQQAKVGYYTADSFAPASPNGSLLWGYAMAWRLTRDEAHWDMLQKLFRTMELGELGDADGSDWALRLDTDKLDSGVLYALLDLYAATQNKAMLQLACRIGDNLMAMQSPSGLFPRSGREWARTGDEIPLALTHLAAAIEGKSNAMPPPVSDRQFFHAVYYGELEEHQKKRADERTYDSYVYYGSQ